MDTLCIGLALSGLGGIGWLSYQHPKYSGKLIRFLLVFAVIAQLLFNKYQSASWETFSGTERSILQQLASFDSLSSKQIRKSEKNKLQKIRQSISQVLVDSTGKIKSLNENCTEIALVIDSALLALYVFSTISPNQKTRIPKD